MCGIAGWIRAYPKDDGQASELVGKLTQSIAHRGPDGDGAWLGEHNRVGLVHTRLAIIDPQSRSDQPMVDRASGAVIIFNGEIYNYRTLRRELLAEGIEFITQSDTEVLLKGYLKHGLGFVGRLRGMYAFAIYDPLRQEIVACRDPCGIKPLYIREMKDGVYFGSTARGLANLEIPCELDPAAAVSFITLGCVLEPLTSYRSITMARPFVAYIWRLTGDGVKLRTERIESCHSGNGENAATGVDLKTALAETVRAHFESDVQVAVLQSTGLDSTIITSLAVEQGLKPVLVTLSFEEFRDGPLDEIPGAKAIADRMGLEFHGVYLGDRDFRELAAKFLDEMESPTTDAINVYMVTNICRKLGLKVAISGLGGDELFGGYPSFKRLPQIFENRGLLTAPIVRQATDVSLMALGSLRSRSPKLQYLTRYLDSFKQLYLFQRAVFLPEQATQALHPDIIREGMPRFLEAFDELAGPRTEGDAAQVRHLECEVYMRNMLLRDADWAGMANGIEVRTPFVDARFYNNIGAADSVLHYGKADLRDLLNASSSAADIASGPKRGFSVPYQYWFRSNRRAAADGHSGRGIQNWCLEVAGHTFPDWGPDRTVRSPSTGDA